MTLRPIFNKSQVALLYYRRVAPDRGYTPKKALNQLIQDNKIDTAILREVIEGEVKKQIKTLK